MKHRVEISPQALADVEAAVEYIRARAPESVARWYDRLMERVESLAVRPNRCPLASEAEKLGIPLRQLLFGKRRGVYRILFTVEGRIVRIHSIRHAARRFLDEEAE
jgi:plasmid stabilization system protein ParE